MAYIIEVPNPFEPLNQKRHCCPGGISVRGWLQQHYPDFKEFPLPTICVINGLPVLRKHWNDPIGDDDIVVLAAQPQGYYLVAIIAIVVVIAISIYIAIAIDIPRTPGELPASAPVFSTRGQSNTIRLGEPIECCYGRNRLYPSFASRPYFKYIDNQQFQYSLFCLGQGQYQIEQILIGDTDINSYQEVEYEILNPGAPVTLFPIGVITSIEAGGQTLFTPNEPEWTQEWTGPFAMNPPGTVTTKLEVDVIMPKGIYSVTKKGKLELRSVQLKWEARLINDAGTPLGSYFDLFSPAVKIIQLATTTPQRRTFTVDVPSGRYETRIKRTNNKDRSHKAGNDAILEAMRSYIDVEQDYGDVSLMAVKIRASNNLNDRTQIRFNAILTRKLPIRVVGDTDANSDGWTDPIPTRSIVWAFVDAFRSLYGGRITEDVYYDWDTLAELDALYESRNEHFDWIFRDPITVWEAARVIARVGRATPILAGSLITMKRESPASIPVAFFNQENIIKGTFELEVKLWDLEENDSLSVEYTEPATGYKQEQVLCVLPAGTTNNPEDIRIVGIQDRAHAYREGLFILASKRYLRENVSFETGMEGHLPSFGDLVAIVHDVPRWGQGGFVVSVTEGVNSGEWVLFLSESLDWTVSGARQILLRGKDGSVQGPFTAVQTTDDKQVQITYYDTDVDFLLNGTTEPMLYLFGIAGQVTKYGKIVRIEPMGGERVKITAVNYEPLIHSFDELEPPALEDPVFPPAPPDLPTIANLYVTEIDGVLKIVQVSWTAAFGAQYYIVETSEDGESWQEHVETTQTSLQLQVRVGGFYVRVAAVNNGQGPWITDGLTIGVVGGLDDEIPWEALEWQVSWFQVLNAESYLVKVYDNSSPSDPILKHSASLTPEDTKFFYDYVMALSHSNITREMLVTVDAVFSDEGATGEPSEVELSNSIPLPPANLNYDFVTEDSTGAIYRLYWEVPEEGDLYRIKVWVSDTPGFDPEVVTPIVDEAFSDIGWEFAPTETQALVDLDSDGEHTTHYWRVALFDVWGNEIATNITAEQTIPSYP